MASLLLENLKIALSELRANPFRSLLTTLGIVIAVAAVVAVVSIIQGGSEFLLGQLQGMGANLIIVYPKRPAGPEGERMGRIQLTYEDAQAIGERCQAVGVVSPYVERQVKVAAGGDDADARVVATTPDYQETRNYAPDQGRFFSQREVDRAVQVAVVGDQVVEDLGTTRERLLGGPLTIQGRTFQVIGFLEPKGALMGRSQDDVVIIPITCGFRLFGRSNRDRLLISATALGADQSQTAVDQISWLLRLRHNRRGGDPDDFGVFTQDQVLDSFQQFSLAATGIVAGVVSVALIVGGIGIMNIMLVSVTERTREIGVRKALGARNRDILVQFLVEAVVLSSLGGVAGIGLGYLTGMFVRETIALWVDWPPVFVPWWAVALALTFSGSVGLIAGVYPAWKAARLDPIEALRRD